MGGRAHCWLPLFRQFHHYDLKAVQLLLLQAAASDRAERGEPTPGLQPVIRWVSLAGFGSRCNCLTEKVPVARRARNGSCEKYVAMIFRAVTPSRKRHLN